MRQAMIQRQPSFYTYFNIALCHSAVNAIFLKD